MFKTLTPASAIERLSANDPTLTVCNLSKSAVLQMKGPELMPQIGAALAKNTVCQELILTECNISDSMLEGLAAALETNKSLVHLNLEGNKVGSDGSALLANALAKNGHLLILNLFAQKGGKPLGDATLHAFCDMFETNVTLLKITWRLESRQSFRLNKLLVRNNDIDRRIKAGRDYADILPSGVAPLTNAQIAQREAAQHLVGGQPASARMSDRSSDMSERSTSAHGSSSSLDVSERSNGAASAAAIIAASRASSSEVPSGQTLEEALAALDVEYDAKVGELKASFDARRKALVASMGGAQPVGLS